jgi:tRNA(Ile)-lysidine synthase
MMRLITGSGLAGLRGIHPRRDDGFVRPLLGVRREAIEAFLHERGLTPRIDRSNDDPRFLRNRVRRAVRELGTTDSLAAVAEQSRMLWPIVERAIDESERACAEVDDTETRFRTWPESSWLRQALLHRHIRRLDPAARDVGSRALGRIASQLDRIRRTSITKRLELVRQDDILVLRTPPQPATPFEVELAPAAPAAVSSLGITVQLRAVADLRTHEANVWPDSPLSPPRGRRVRARGSLPPGDPSTGQLFQLPPGADPRFIVRNRRPGDRFQPLGLGAPKKLKDLLIDRKIARETRDRIPLLVWQGEIVWIAGVELSERFKVTDSAGDRYAVWMEDSDGATDPDRVDPGLHR